MSARERMPTTPMFARVIHSTEDSLKIAFTSAQTAPDLVESFFE